MFASVSVWRRASVWKNWVPFIVTIIIILILTFFFFLRLLLCCCYYRYHYVFGAIIIIIITTTTTTTTTINSTINIINIITIIILSLLAYSQISLVFGKGFFFNVGMAPYQTRREGRTKGLLSSYASVCSPIVPSSFLPVASSSSPPPPSPLPPPHLPTCLLACSFICLHSLNREIGHSLCWHILHAPSTRRFKLFRMNNVSWIPVLNGCMSVTKHKHTLSMSRYCAHIGRQTQ